MGTDRNEPAIDRWLRDLAVSVAGSRNADDLAQETLVAALAARRPRGDRRAWLAGILRNLARMEKRRGARRDRRERLAARKEGVQGAAEAAARAEAQRVVAEAVGRLPAAHRDTVLLHFHEGLSLAEIARRDGVPASTARNRLRRALLRLRVRLHAAFGGDPRPLVLAPIALPRRSTRAGGAARSGGGARCGGWLRVPVAAAILCGVAWAGAGTGSGNEPSTRADRPPALTAPGRQAAHRGEGDTGPPIPRHAERPAARPPDPLAFPAP